MSYAPKPGTNAFRILAWLRQQGETQEFNTSQIGNALDIANKYVAPSLEQALRERMVFARRKDLANQRAPVWYSLTDHSPAAPALGWQRGDAPQFRGAPDVPTFRGRATDTPQGDQPRSERGREVMEPAVCESAAGRGTTGAPALATLPQHASPGVGPMGAGQPADAGPVEDHESAAQQEAPTNSGRVEPAATPPAAPPLPPLVREEPREVDEQFARSIDAALADPEMRFALWDDDTLICVARGAVQWRCTPEQTERLRALLGGW